MATPPLAFILFADFNWTSPHDIDCKAIGELMTSRYISRADNTESIEG